MHYFKVSNVLSVIIFNFLRSPQCIYNFLLHTVHKSKVGVENMFFSLIQKVITASVLENQ